MIPQYSKYPSLNSITIWLIHELLFRLSTILPDTELLIFEFPLLGIKTLPLLILALFPNDDEGLVADDDRHSR